MVGGVWNGYLLGKVRGSLYLACSVVLLMVMVTFFFFWKCPYPPLVEIRENPKFHDLMRGNKGHCHLLWHGWLPLLSGTNGASPWAESAAQGAGQMLEQVLGASVLAIDV